MLQTLPPHWRYTWLVAASFLAGALNAMAGGGSFLSFPAMLGVGVPPVQANATNTVALWPGQLTSYLALRDDLPRALLPVVAGTSSIGGIAGAVVLLHTRQVTFVHLIPWLLLTGALLFWISGPFSTWLRTRARRTGAEHPVREIKPSLALALALLPICFYVGYFGAGGGFLIMTVLALFGLESMHALNSLKIVAAGIANLFATITFIVSGAVLWHYCLVSMLFAAAGGYVGARYARRIDPAVLRTIVVVTGITIAAYFFWRQRTA